MVKKRAGKAGKKRAKRAGKGAKSLSRREVCKSCGCKSGKKWEECCGRCMLPC